MGTIRIELVRTNGIFSIDGEDFDVENNIWLLGDDHEVLVIDAAHDAAPIAEAVGDRTVRAIVCTHGHNDHINAADALSHAVGNAPVLLHVADEMLWDTVYPDRKPDAALRDGEELDELNRRIQADVSAARDVFHTGAQLANGFCQRAFGGDTLFKGGPGATGRSFSDFPTIIASIRDRLFVLAPDTIVHTGHGDTTTIGDESPHLDEWLARGH